MSENSDKIRARAAMIYSLFEMASRANGFVLRVRKDLSLTDKNLQKVLADATSNLLSDKEDEAVDMVPLPLFVLILHYGRPSVIRQQHPAQ